MIFSIFGFHKQVINIALNYVVEEVKNNGHGSLVGAPNIFQTTSITV